MAKKIISLFLCAAFFIAVFSACSSDKQPENDNNNQPIQTADAIPADDSSFKLSFSQSDSLDPYESETLNNQILAHLVFESLFDIDENFKASANLAESYRYSNSKTLEVTIPNHLIFSDGSALTADDVTYSFRKASKSAFWGSSLSSIKTCNAASSTVIEFRLESPNNYAHNLLIFPIISRSSENSRFPIGNGRYCFAEGDDGTILKAVVSENFNPHFTTIHLENITASDSIDNAMNIGNISLEFRDLSRNSTKKMESNYKLVDINNLVYIGVNNKSGITANSNIRKAISLAVSRETLAKSAYSNFAKPASTVFVPGFELASTEIFAQTENISAAKQAIAQSGISDLSVSLLVNGTNSDRVTCAKLIKNQLDAAGFKVKISTASSYENYESMIKKEQFDLYLGEIKITPDMSLRSFFSDDGSSNYGIDTKKSNSAAEYNNYLNGETELGSFLLAFSEEMPYIPLLYRQGMICFSKEMNGDVQGTYTDCFKNIENWYFKAK